jgi:hypothetical protein
MGLILHDAILPEERQTNEAKTIDEIGVQIPQVYLPRQGVDMTKWAVVACDQYTSQPEYWEQVENIVGDEPSTLNLTLPEIFLGKEEEAARADFAQKKMQEYLDSGVLIPYEGLIYVERTINQKTRRGIMLCLDLEKYNYNKGSQSLIRATEGTIIDRLPPRMKIRQGALLEVPHILVLIDDPECEVIEPLTQVKDHLSKLYDFDLMMDSGHLTGYLIDDPVQEAKVIRALEHLSDPDVFAEKYGLDEEKNIFLFAMGDGNHSLATAKAIWEQIKPQVGMDHPARYALVEVENVHDSGLDFEPIHRALFNVKVDIVESLKNYYGEKNISFKTCKDCLEMVDIVEETQGEKQAVGLLIDHKFSVLEISNPTSNLAVGTLQPFLDSVLEEKQADKLDYVHGKCVVCRLSARPHTIGFYLPKMEKSDLFKTVILDGALPRKTFSMGEAREKRFYMECRRIA